MANQIDATPNEMKNEFGLAMPRLASCRHTDHPPSAMKRNPERYGRRGKAIPAAASSTHQTTKPANAISNVRLKPDATAYAVALLVSISGFTGSL
jgi:hypothetical protein